MRLSIGLKGWEGGGFGIGGFGGFGGCGGRLSSRRTCLYRLRCCSCLGC